LSGSIRLGTRRHATSTDAARLDLLRQELDLEEALLNADRAADARVLAAAER